MPETLTVKPKVALDFEAIFESLPTPLLLMDRDFTIVAMNQTFCNTNGVSRDELTGQNIFAAFPAGKESRWLLQQSFERAREQGVVDVVPLVSYAHVVNGRAEERLWSCTHIPVRDKTGQVAFLLKNAHDISELCPALREGLEPCASLKEASERQPSAPAKSRDAHGGPVSLEVLNQPLMATVQHLRRLVMQAPSFMCVLRGPELVFEMVNTAFSMLASGRDLIGKTLREGMPELEAQDLPRVLEGILKTGEVHFGRKTRIFVQDPQDGDLEEHFIDFVAQPIICAKGEITGIFIEGNDVTDHVRTQERQALLIRELHHRVRNTLAMVQGLMTTSASTAVSFEEFQQAFCERIASLAKTHAVMTDELDQSVSFQHLLTQELGPYSDEHGLRVRLTGPAVDLPSQLAVPLGMAVHELTTNAVKHGALSTEEGWIEVGWGLTEKNGESALVCEWNEFAGQPVIPPCREGFGSLLLNRVLAQQIRADVKVEFVPDGLRLRLAVPLQARQ
jgi:PAS domain S-box-containing protein